MHALLHLRVQCSMNMHAAFTSVVSLARWLSQDSLRRTLLDCEKSLHARMHALVCSVQQERAFTSSVVDPASKAFGGHWSC